jgi:hypothetical protein
MREPGHIYILVNPSMEGLVKVGKTTREPEARAKELSQATGVATPFYVAYSIVVGDCHSAEEYVHAVLEYNGFKRSPNREFFQIPLRTAIEVLLVVEKELAGHAPVPEHSEDRENLSASTATDPEEPLEARHPGQAVLRRARDAYYGFGDEIEDKKEALRLLHQAKSLNFPAAYTSLAWHHNQEGEHARTVADDEVRAHEHHEKAFEVLKEGAQRGHGRCYIRMADMYIFGLMNQNWDSDTLNANKCWRKYFHSETFANDDDERWGQHENALEVFCSGASRAWHGQMYLTCCFSGPMTLDPEIREILHLIREEVIQSVRDTVASYEKEATGVPPVITSTECPESKGGPFRLIARIVGLGSKKPMQEQPRDQMTERLEEQRRFLSYVESVLTGHS